MMVIYPVPLIPLSEGEIALEAQNIRDAFALGETAHVSQDFLDRCQFEDCLRLLELLPYPGLALNVPTAPDGAPFFTIPTGG